MKTISKTKVLSCIPPCTLIIVGCYSTLHPQFSYHFLCCLLGVIFMCYGVVKLICYLSKDMYQLAFQFDFAMGLFSFAVGLLIFCGIKPIQDSFPIFIGIMILIEAVFKIQTAIDAKRFGMEKWWFVLILSITTALVAFLLIIRPLKNIDFVLRYLDLSLILDGCLNLWTILYTVKERTYNHPQQCP